MIANAIPAVGGLMDFHAARRRRAAEVVPDMHILRSRLNGQIADLSRPGSISAELVRQYIRYNGGSLEILSGLIRLAPGQGLLFTNELYILRHLLTQARHEMAKAAVEAVPEGRDPGPVLVARERLVRALNLYVAAKTTLAEAERLLPAKSRDLGRETFWERFARVSTEREQGAEAQRMREIGV